MIVQRSTSFRVFAAFAIFTGCIGSGIIAHAQGTDWKVVEDAGRVEKTVTFYSSLVENVNRAVSDAFEKKYGIRVNVLRLASGTLTQRYSAEAQAGSASADVIMPSSSGPFLASALKNGWTTDVTKAGLPAIQSKEYPAKWLHADQGAAIVQVLPWLFGYNDQSLKTANATLPKNWPDLLDPKFKNQILISDPAATDSYIQLWQLVLQTYGESYFTKLKAQNFRIVDSGAPNIQALAAGEGIIGLPTIGSLVQGVASKGAPVFAILPQITTGNEIAITLSNKAPHPNAARLLVNFLLTHEGNALLSGAPMEFSVYRDDLPAGYQSPDPDAVAKSKAKILSLLKGP